MGTKISLIIIFSLFFFCSAFLLTGCSFVKPLLKESKNLETLGNSSVLDEPLEGRFKSFENLKGIVHINLKAGKKGNSFNMVTVLKSPDLFRFEILNPLNQPIAFITSDGKNIYQTDLKNSNLTVFPISKQASEKLLGLPFVPSELIEIITGNVPVGKSEHHILQFDKDNNFYILTLFQSSDETSDNKLVKKYWIEQARLIPLKLEVSEQSGKTLYEVDYSDYRDINNYQLPGKIECNYFLKNILVKINFKDISLNSEVDQSLFNFQTPSGFKVIYSE